jgi:hypothetical protein
MAILRGLSPTTVYDCDFARPDYVQPGFLRPFLPAAERLEASPDFRLVIIPRCRSPPFLNRFLDFSKNDWGQGKWITTISRV